MFVLVHVYDALPKENILCTDTDQYSLAVIEDTADNLQLWKQHIESFIPSGPSVALPLFMDRLVNRTRLRRNVATDG